MAIHPESFVGNLPDTPLYQPQLKLLVHNRNLGIMTVETLCFARKTLVQGQYCGNSGT
jgi:hypothetical protein